jgi:hypothetical protein
MLLDFVIPIFVTLFPLSTLSVMLSEVETSGRRGLDTPQHRAVLRLIPNHSPRSR